MVQWFIYAFVSAISLSLVAVLRKKLLFKEHATEYLTSRFLITAILLIPALKFVDFSVPPTIWGMIYIKAVILTFALILMAKASRHMEISSVAPLTNFSPVFLVFLSFIFLGDVINFFQGIGIVLVLTGSYVLELKKSKTDIIFKKNKYLLLVFIALFLAAVTALLDKIILKQAPVANLLVFPILIIAVHFLFIQFIKYNGIKDLQFSFRIGGLIILLTALLGISSEFFYLKAVAIPGAYISLIVVIIRSSSLISTILGGEMFHEHNLVHKLVAATITLLGIALIVL